MVAFPNYRDVGYTTLYNVNGGRLAEDYNHAYPVPCQIKFAGLYMRSDVSSTYDTSAHEAFPVMIPCDQDGMVPEGWTWMSTRRNDLLQGAPAAYFPEDRFLKPSGFVDKMEYFEVIAVPAIKIGEKTGVPVKAGQNLVVGDEISVAVGGFAKKAIAGEYVVGRAESTADNSALTATDGAIYVAVKHGRGYIKE